MSNTLTISLHNLHFFAYHGLYAEEKKSGAEFEVNVSVAFQPGKMITALVETVNYENIFSLVKSEMQKPRELLETLAMDITQAIYLSYPSIKKIEISISKLRVPITGFSGSIAVRYEKEF
jgi:dihydroneopterin aldolase